MFKRILLVLGILFLSFNLVFAITPTIEVGTDEVPIGPAKEATLTSIKTAIEIMDDWNSADHCKIIPKASMGIVLAADGQIKATAGTLYGCIVSFVGVTAGDKIEIKNSVDATGTSLCTIISPVANAVYTFTPVVGITYSTAIYYDVTLATGTATITAVFE